MTENTSKVEGGNIIADRYLYREPDKEVCETLASEMEIPYPLAVLLFQRGIKTPQDGEDFLIPKLSSLPSPFLMKNMDKAVALIHDAMRENWPIYIHGDYDVDGITSSALLSRFFKQIGRITTSYQPNRLTEGYGLQEEFIRAKAPYQNQTALLITVDCGISDFHQVQIAKELGFKVIVTDHHLPGDTLPVADAVINPQQNECQFPHPALAGVGVAFFLAYAIRNKLVEEGVIEKEKAPNLKKLMDLVAMGTVADVMPLTGINRLLVRAGLEVINQPECVWATALKEQVNKFSSGKCTSEDISYKFAPRINAPGRLGNPELAFELLSSDSLEECREIAGQIEVLNQQRRDHEKGMLDQVVNACKLQDEAGATGFVVAGDFHQGVVGIIASRVVDIFHKPVIIFTEDVSRLGTFKGSGRSIDNINLYDVLSACTNSIIQFGGHAMAAGLAIHKDNLSFFTKQFQSVVKDMEVDTVSKSTITVDYCPSQEEIFEKSFLAKYQYLQPFGNENPEPVFLLTNPKVVETSVVKNNHLTFTLKVENKIFRGIGFGMADKLKDLRNNPKYLACKLKNTMYKGEQRVEIHAVDIFSSA